MHDSLHPYQISGARFLASRHHAYLGDEMGLGKTPQAIRAADFVNALHILVVCPAIARVNWAREFLRWQDIPRSTVVVGITLAGLPPQTPTPNTVTIVSYEMAVNLVEGLSKQRFDLIIFDEFHYLKSAGAKRSQTLIGANGLAHHAKRVWLLSGTAIANHPGEIWTGLRVFYPAALREPDDSFLSHDDFIGRYCRTKDTPYGIKIVGVKDLGPLKKAMQPFFLRRTVDDVEVELPPYSWSDVAIASKLPIDLPHYDDSQVKSWLAKDGEYQLQANENTSSLMRLLGLCKADAVIELAKDTLDSGIDKLVVFAWHHEVLDRLQVGLQDFGVVRVDGTRTPQQNQQTIDAFQRGPLIKVFIGQIKSCGTAIDLTAAHHAIFAEMSWVPSDNSQAAKRLHRVTQTKPVLVRCVKLIDSLDDAVTATLRRKSSMIHKMFN